MQFLILGIVILLFLFAALCVYFERRRERKEWEEECKQHSGFKYLGRRELTVKLAESGWVCTRINSEDKYRIVTLPDGMWEDDYNEMMDKVSKAPNVDSKCAIMNAYLGLA